MVRCKLQKHIIALRKMDFKFYRRKLWYNKILYGIHEKLGIIRRRFQPKRKEVYLIEDILILTPLTTPFAHEFA